ncbi:MAG: methyltransferase domain-containing protein, partial [Elusimicrobiota bacterium]
NLVTCMSVFEHLSDPWKACREINRILKRGGHIACSMAFLEPYHGQSHFHFSHKGAKKLFVETGFKILKLLPLGFTYSEACLRELAPIPLLPSVSGFCVKNILRLRKIGIKFIASYYKKRDSGKYNRAVEYGEEDNFRFEAGFKILGIKS